MKTQSKKLDFTKNSITELNENHLVEVKGGTSPLCVSILISVSVYTYYETGTKEAVEVIKEEITNQ